MSDVVEKWTRSRKMAGIGPTDTASEISVGRYLNDCGLLFRLHARRLPGRADIVMAAATTLIHALLGLPADLTHRGVFHAYVDAKLVAETLPAAVGTASREA